MSFAIDLAGRRALVTGAGQHIGRAIAHSLASAGAEVVVNDILPERAGAVVEEIVAAGGTSQAAVFDVTQWSAVSGSIGEVAPDILVNNLGATGAGDAPEAQRNQAWPRFVESDPSDWDLTIAVNLFGVMYCTRAALPAMLDRKWGRVITIISDAARVGERRMAAYAAGKAGAAAFSRAVATEVGGQGITVNCVSLGTVQSEHPVSAEHQERRDRSLVYYPAGRFGRPTDPAAMVTFLASDHAEWITAQTYPVNGGYSSAL